jgi:hypothetical protein
MKHYSGSGLTEQANEDANRSQLGGRYREKLRIAESGEAEERSK